MSRLSSCALCLPPIENGWQGGPPASRSISLPMASQSNSLTSPSWTFQPATSGYPQALFSRIVSHAHLSHSTTACGSKPARWTPIASPPAPAYSSTHFIRFSPCQGSASIVDQAIPCSSIHIPKPRIHASPILLARQLCGYLVRDCLRVSPSKSRASILVSEPMNNFRAYAKSNHARTQLHAGNERPNLVFLVSPGNVGDICIPCHERACGRPFLVSCQSSESKPCVGFVPRATLCPLLYFSS